ncbi:hypothetical protein B0H66DRAFT_606727 [Apodospora peruviana]|uniref:Uncharacterized protein n=1 Tax=Apodospora peruviana TaxID=516989 RepID=A0AAE0HVS8_9PEZI|nr:hypothetical protein B0H66DRAFT_606727 [Apodospora peruviana]
MASLIRTAGTRLSQELQSRQSPPDPPERQIAPAPKVGDRAPQSSPDIAFPTSKPVIIVFLRHCGDAFAEKTFNKLTAFSVKHPSIKCIAVSHSSQSATDKWVIDVGGEWEVEVLVDPERNLYAQWGLGLGSTWQVMGPSQVINAYRLGTDEGIWGQVVEGDESGNKWQMGGAFAVDCSGAVRWVHIGGNASDIPDFEEGRKALEDAKKVDHERNGLA